MSRVSPARPLHVIGWVTALVALAWFASTSTGAEVDQRFAGWVRDLRAGTFNGDLNGLFVGITEVFRPLYVAPAAVIGALLLWRRLRVMALLVPLAFATSIAMTYAMKWILDRDRPSGALRLSELPALHDGAFPSAHVAGVTGTGMAAIQVLAPMIRRGMATALKWAVVVLIGAVALSRVWVGAHWLSDVVGGLAAGVVGLIIALLVMRSAPVRRMMSGGRRF
ncbi:phosphatase PAP2 family protein [uncultured Corynebacterium sp.]|uniref:phosphatase PAP2 family protein n=1 Tax=uncultured Corynebacterium sp. TaxID=159447 RepID=UPI0025DA2ADB|nr:phosphatase PAP2 family protein [uncultured Corynebacterium sp.]